MSPLGLILPCLFGCSTGYSSSHLPEWISATVRFEDGSHGAALVGFGHPRDPPEVRYAPGLLSFDGGRLLELVPAPRWLGDGRIVQDLGVRDHARDSKKLLAVGDYAERARVVAVVDGAIAIEAGSEMIWFDSFTGERVESRPVDRALEHFGPGQGFSISHEEGIASLGLPMSNVRQPLFQDVDALISVAWLKSDEVDSRALASAHERFKAVLPLRGRGAPAVIDGNLDDWRGDKALAVDHESCVQRGKEGWSGPRDGSFGVAVRVHDAALKLAIRIRDDALLLGEDTIEVQVDEETWVIPLAGAGEISGLENGIGVFTDAVDFGTGLELSLPGPLPPPDPATLPIIVRYIDRDPGEEATVLASAPSMKALTIRRFEVPAQAGGKIDKTATTVTP